MAEHPPGWTLAAASLGFAVVQLDVSVVNVAIPSIGQSLHGSVSGLQWVVTAYTVTFAALILSAGALGDRMGARRLYVAGFALFTLASAVCGLAPSLAVLVAARAVQGVGAAVLVPCSLTLLNHAYDDDRARARAVGLWAAGASVALSGGPLVGGLLTSTVGWRWIFFINAPIGLLGIWLTVRYASETSRDHGRGVDVPGQVLVVLALGALTASVIAGGERGFGDRLVLCGFVLAAVAGGAFVLVEGRARRPMLPLSLFRSRNFSAASAIGLLINIAFYGLLFVLSLYFQQAQHRSPLETGLAFAPMTAVVLVTNVLADRVSRRIGAGRAIAAGAVAGAAGAACLLGASAHTTYTALVVPLVALGAGLGLIVPVMTSVLLADVDPRRSGVASGTLNTARQTGSVVGVALFGAFAAGAAGVVAGLHLSLAVSVGLMGAVAGLAAVVRH